MTTSPAIAELIDRLAEDKATRLKLLTKTLVVMAECPEWAQAGEINAWFGLPLNQITKLAMDGKVTAKKTNPLLTSSAVIYKTADIRRAIGKMMDLRDWAKTRPDQNQNN